MNGTPVKISIEFLLGERVVEVLEEEIGLRELGGEEAVAQKLYEMPLAYCRKHNIRHYGALMMSNLGRSLIQGSMEDIQKGWSLLDEAEGMIQGMHEPFILGYIHLSKGEAEYKQGHFLPAQDFFQKAHRIYAEAQSMLWQGTSALWMAKAKLGARQPRVGVGAGHRQPQLRGSSFTVPTSQSTNAWTQTGCTAS